MNEEIIQTLKDTLAFLLEQEKIRAEEITALNDKINAINDMVMSKITEADDFLDDQRYRDFKGKYGDQLSAFDEQMSAIQGEPYDTTRNAYEEFRDYQAPEGVNISEEEYVGKAVEGLQQYLDGLKTSMGLPADTDIEVKADLDGDGKAETTVVDETTEKEEVVEEEMTPEDEAFMNEINAAADKAVKKGE